MGPLLAIDLGIKTGLALYRPEGKLCWYRSKNFGTATALRRGANSLLNSLPDLALLVVEGSGPLAVIWEREAERRNILYKRISAEQWRHTLLYPREQHTGLQAKHHADDLARRIIKWSGITRASSLRHDTAEAILIGFWAVLEAGWLKELPHELRR
ncbi:MAG: hypothetical protein C4581_08840 [Nitrospiraceae bacterium]|nr:MAG: hypothetical protein C4581_08840 [Nitrospiraceae bacterium]